MTCYFTHQILHPKLLTFFHHQLGQSSQAGFLEKNCSHGEKTFFFANYHGQFWTNCVIDYLVGSVFVNDLYCRRGFLPMEVIFRAEISKLHKVYPSDFLFVCQRCDPLLVNQNSNHGWWHVIPKHFPSYIDH